MLQNRLFNRGSDISRLIAGMLPLPVWQSMMTARGDNGNIAGLQKFGEDLSGCFVTQDAQSLGGSPAGLGGARPCHLV